MLKVLKSSKKYQSYHKKMKTFVEKKKQQIAPEAIKIIRHCNYFLSKK